MCKHVGSYNYVCRQGMCSQRSHNQPRSMLWGNPGFLSKGSARRTIERERYVDSTLTKLIDVLSEMRMFG